MLVVAALMTNAGTPWSTDPAGPLTIALRPDEALSDLAQLVSLFPPEAIDWNSIDLHDAMVARDDIAYAPCVYGYATYGEADMRRRLSFGPFPGPAAAGTAIGGTAIAISRSSALRDAAARFVEFILGTEAQADIVPRFHGQPALLAAWNDPIVDARFNGYYSATRETMEHAWIRPRLPGYPCFQKLAGIEAQKALAGEQTFPAAVENILAHAAQVNN